MVRPWFTGPARLQAHGPHRKRDRHGDFGSSGPANLTLRIRTRTHFGLVRSICILRYRFTLTTMHCESLVHPHPEPLAGHGKRHNPDKIE